MNKNERPNRPIIKYHGGKWRLGKWIVPILEEIQHDLYCEPFGGSAAVLLQKERSLMEVWNDMSWDLHNFFTVLREAPEQLVWAIQNTPYSYSEWQYASSIGAYFAKLENSDETGSPRKIKVHGTSRGVFDHINNLERARLFYIRCQMSIMGEGVINAGFRRQKMYSRGISGKSSMKPASLSFMETEHIWQTVDRLRGVVLENAPASDIISLYDKPETLFYVDPPYLGTTRARRVAYHHELVSKADHIDLLVLLETLNSMVVLSGYPSELYKTHLERKGWRRLDHQARINGAGQRIESLWLNRKTQERLEQAKKEKAKVSARRLL